MRWGRSKCAKKYGKLTTPIYELDISQVISSLQTCFRHIIRIHKLTTTTNIALVGSREFKYGSWCVKESEV